MWGFKGKGTQNVVAGYDEYLRFEVYDFLVFTLEMVYYECE